jgi:D-aminoacyl-tRNA deacylase
MKFAIVVSEKDIAGMNIKERLLEGYTFIGKGSDYELKENKNISLHIIKEDTIHSEELDKRIEADIFIFATRHKAKAGIKTLTCHTPGNFGKAEFGGRDKKLCVAYANLMKKAYLKLKENSEGLDYYVSLECTHHGPYIEKPCMFIEIGSTEDEWRDEKAAKAVAKTIIDIIKGNIPEDKAAIGLGGLHYCDNFNKLLERSDIAVGHICPKYNLENLDEDMLKQMTEKSKENAEFVILDWKGLGKEKQRIVELLEKLKIKYLRTDKI